MSAATGESSPLLERYRRLAVALDAEWRIPLLGTRFGWDAIIGLVPGFGDALAALIGAYGLYVGWRLGAPAVVLARMALNLGIETLVGTVPLAGDLFDIAFRADLRNVALLDHWIAAPRATRRRSLLLFGTIVLVFLGTIGAILGLFVWALTLLLTGTR
jgi:hypothetical protein